MKRFFRAIFQAALCYIVFDLPMVLVAFSIPILALIGMIGGALFGIPGGARLVDGLYALIDAQYDLITVVAAVISFLLFLMFFRARGTTLWREASLGRVRASSVVVGALWGVASAFFFCLLLSYAPWPDALIGAYDEMYSQTESTGVLGFIATVLVAPFLEELTFRGLILPRLRGGMACWIALLAQAIWFGLLHGTPLWMASAVCAGLTYGFFALHYKSLWPCVAAHVCYNLFGGYLVSWLLHGTDMVADTLVFLASVAVMGALALYIFYTAPNRFPPEKLYGQSIG